jgi:hypothetical protein
MRKLLKTLRRIYDYLAWVESERIKIMIDTKQGKA